MLNFITNALRFVNEPVPSFFFGVFLVDANVTSLGVTADAAATAQRYASSAIGILSQADPIAAAYTEVTGLSVGADEESKFDGGSNLNIVLPKGLKTDKLTLKRYLRPRHMAVGGFSLDPITGWCQQTMDIYKKWHRKIVLKHVMVVIYHPQLKNPLPVGPSAFPIAGYMAEEAYPLSWYISDLGSMTEEPIVETIELSYKRLYRLSLPTGI